MTKNNCIISNIILGVSLGGINSVPFILPFDIGSITYLFISLFDILAIYLTFALDLHFAKENNFNVKDTATYVVTPLVIPTVVIAIIYALIKM